MVKSVHRVWDTARDMMDPEELAKDLSSLMEREAGDAGIVLFKRHCRNSGVDPRRLTPVEGLLLARPLLDLIRPVIGPERAVVLFEKMKRMMGLDEVLDDPLTEPRTKFKVLSEMALVYAQMGQHDLSEELLGSAFDIAAASGLTGLWADVMVRMGYIAADRGDYERALALFEGALRGCSDDRPDDMARALCAVGYVNWKLARYSEAENIFQKGLGLIQGAGTDIDPGLLGLLHTGLANVWDETGRKEQAARGYALGIGYLKTAESDSELARAYNNLGDLKLKQGLFDEAASSFMLSRQAAERVGDVVMVAWADFNLGEVYIRAGILEKAYYLLERARPVLERGYDRQGQAALCRNFGMYYGELENWQECDASFNAALGSYEDLDLPYSQAITHKEYARYLWRQGRKEDAAGHAHEASAILSDMGLVEEADQVLSML